MNIQINKQGGQAMMATGIMFLFIGSSIILGVVTPVINQIKSTENQLYSKSSYYVSESGIEDVSYRVKNNLAYSPTEQISINGVTASTSATTVGTTIQVTSLGETNDVSRKNTTSLQTGAGAAFNYGVQVGAGGVSIYNSATVKGNLYSNGPVLATNSGKVEGDAVSAGPSGKIEGVVVTGSAYANTIKKSIISQNAYYQTITGSTVNGTSYPGSANQATTSFPIPEQTIADWQAAATAGGTITSCPYSVWNQTITLGPKKINCDMDISGNSVIKLTGPVWVTGNINLSNNAEVRVDSSLGNQSVALIADSTTDDVGKGRIILSNSTKYAGSGSPNSFVLLVSMNKSASTGGSNSAISISNSAQGDLILYAPLGKISLANSVQLSEVTAYLVEMSNSATVTYKTGLQNLLFTSGPGGGYQFSGWKETQ